MPMGPGTYGSKKGRPPLKLDKKKMTPEMKKKLEEALKKGQKKKPKKSRKPKYNPYGPGSMNPTKASYGTGP